MRKKIFSLAGVLCFGFLLPNWTSAEQSQSRPHLWAAISVSEPLFHEGWTKDLLIHFTVVNDGGEAVNPKLTASHIIINGEELKDTAFILGNGPRDARWDSLPPGDGLKFTYALGEYFKEPGIYKVSWKGEGFEAPAIVFRVMSRKKQAH